METAFSVAAVELIQYCVCFPKTILTVWLVQRLLVKKMICSDFMFFGSYVIGSRIMNIIAKPSNKEEFEKPVKMTFLVPKVRHLLNICFVFILFL